MPKAPTPSVYFGKRVHYRNEVDPLVRAMKRVGWKEASKVENATIVWDVETLADTITTEYKPEQTVNRVPAMLSLCRKAVFAQLLARFRALLPPDSSLDDGRYLPMQWALPLQAPTLTAVVVTATCEHESE